jgi:hypothetical protein
MATLNTLLQQITAASEAVSKNNYQAHDLKIDIDQVRFWFDAPVEFLWFIRETGSTLELLNAPRSRRTIEQIAPMDCWKAVYHINLARELVPTTAAQATSIVNKAQAYRYSGNLVQRPDGTSIAMFRSIPVQDRFGVYDVFTSLRGVNFSFEHGLQRAGLQTFELDLIERCVRDALVDATSSLFSRTRLFQYEILLEHSRQPAVLDADSFRSLFANDGGVVMPQVWMKEAGQVVASVVLPAAPSSTEEDLKTQWLAPFKAAMRSRRGSLHGVRFGCGMPQSGTAHASSAELF